MLTYFTYLVLYHMNYENPSDFCLPRGLKPFDLSLFCPTPTQLDFGYLKVSSLATHYTLFYRESSSQHMLRTLQLPVNYRGPGISYSVATSLSTFSNLNISFRI